MRLDEIVGQRKVKARISIVLKGNEIFPHSLFHGPAGVGKTTFGNAIAEELGTTCYVFNGAALEKFTPMLATFLSLTEGDIVFIDEIHRMKIKVQEMLYTAMENYNIISSSGFAIKIPKFTLLGATTDIGNLSRPMLTRFMHTFALTRYSNEDMFEMLKAKVSFDLTKKAAMLVVKSAKYTPRLLISRVDWLNNYAEVHNLNTLKYDDVVAALDMMDIDEDGLDTQDRLYLNFLRRQCVPVGVQAIAAAINIPVDTITKHIEPYLVESGFVMRTQKGRVAQ